MEFAIVHISSMMAMFYEILRIISVIIYFIEHIQVF